MQLQAATSASGYSQPVPRYAVRSCMNPVKIAAPVLVHARDVRAQVF